MDDATERLTEAEGLLSELASITMAMSTHDGRQSILALRRKGGNQVEEYRTTTEDLRIACRRFLEATGSSFPDPTVVELQKIRVLLSGIEKSVPLSQEIANQIFDMLDANYRLPKRERE